MDGWLIPWPYGCDGAETSWLKDVAEASCSLPHATGARHKEQQPERKQRPKEHTQSWGQPPMIQESLTSLQRLPPLLPNNAVKL